MRCGDLESSAALQLHNHKPARLVLPHHLDGAPVELRVVREPGELRSPARVRVQGLQERLR
jgi:hypothetical protein